MKGWLIENINLSSKGEKMTVNKFFFEYHLIMLNYLSEFDVMVFHEICFSNLNIYRRIKQFVEKSKQSRIIPATGDCK